MARGVCEHALKLQPFEEGYWGNAMVANRTREIRPSGMTPGACGNVDYGSRIEALGQIFGLATEP